MSESKFETVSSLVDNYSQKDESFDEIIKDSELSDTWSRYQLMGDIMRGDAPETLQLDLVDKISAAIENEPTVLAPKTTVTKDNNFKARVVKFVKPFGQLAIAASAAGLMVLGVQQNNVAQTDEVAPVQNIQTSAFVGIAEPVSFNYEQPSQKSQKQAYIEQQRRLQALLVDHKQQMKLTATVTASENNAVTDVENTPNNKVEDLPK